jgi:hypothetical protein
MADVVAHLGPDERVHRRGGEPLELAELRRHLGGGGHEALGVFLQDDLPGAQLMRRVQVGEQEADGDGLDARLLQLARGAADRVLVQRFQNLAPGRDQPLGDGLAVPAAHQGPILPGDLLHDRVVLRPLMAPDMQDVAVSRRGDQPRFHALVLQDGVGGDRGPVHQLIDARRIHADAATQFDRALDDAVGRIVRRRRRLVDHRLTPLGIGVDQVGERPADIDANQFHAILRVARPGRWWERAGHPAALRESVGAWRAMSPV